VTTLPQPDPVPGSDPSILDTGGHVTAGRGFIQGTPPGVPGTSTLTSRLLLGIVGRQAGPEGVRRVLERAGMKDRRAALLTAGGRLFYQDKISLFDAAAAELRDPHIGLRLGPAAMEDPAAAPLRVLARAFGSPAALIRRISGLSMRFDTACVLRCVQVRPGSAVVGWKVLPPHQPSPVDCDYTLGVLAQIPVMFGMSPARVEHQGTCQAKGASECFYHMSWRETAGRVRNLLHWFARDERARGRESSARHRLQVLEEAASELASSAPLEELLDRIAAHADSAVHAPGHLLAVQLPTGGRHVRVRGTGDILAAALNQDDAAPDLADSALIGLPVLSVPVISAAHHYGVLAAVAHPGQEFVPGDTETLGAYARHAAAVLDSAGLLSEARDNAETSELLLEVARTLTEGSTVETVATAIAEAVPILAGASRSAVALWDAEAGQLRIAGLSGWEGELAEKAGQFMTTAQESPELASVLRSGTPLLVGRNGSLWARKVLTDFNVSAFLAVPILRGEQLGGLVVAYWGNKGAPESLDQALTKRLSGLACLAAVALENIRLLEDARWRALHDPLTGLPNRVLLEERLKASLARAHRDGRQVGLVFCDVNRFKRINDSLGHGAGDTALRHVAAQLTAAVRSSDTVARFSGDEFVILLASLDNESEAELLTARIRACLAEPLQLDGRDILVDVAVGTSVSASFPDNFHGEDALAEAARLLIEDADFQMYQSKALSRGQRPLARSKDSFRLEADLRGAAGRGELRVHYQPQIDVATNNIVAVEALVRWHHAELGLLPPGDFIPLAEESNLIGEIGSYVLAEACRAGAGWRTAGHDIEVSVNVSAAQFRSPEFTAFVQDTLQQTGFPAAALTLEVTESQTMSETYVDDSTLHALRALGTGISVDDFGTGYSSLAQLHTLPVTEVKIDRSFTARLAEEGAAAFIAGIVGLGHGLGLRVVAEGVETQAQLEAIRQMKCERAQGYLFSKPVDAATVDTLLHSSVRPADTSAPSDPPSEPLPGSRTPGLPASRTSRKTAT
jgi:diguanylate cyclase (GGDEF)-like protein